MTLIHLEYNLLDLYNEISIYFLFKLSLLILKYLGMYIIMIFIDYNYFSKKYKILWTF